LRMPSRVVGSAPICQLTGMCGPSREIFPVLLVEHSACLSIYHLGIETILNLHQAMAAGTDPLVAPKFRHQPIPARRHAVEGPAPTHLQDGAQSRMPFSPSALLSVCRLIPVSSASLTMPPRARATPPLPGARRQPERLFRPEGSSGQSAATR
jgi:hypothetical protein